MAFVMVKDRGIKVYKADGGLFLKGKWKERYCELQSTGEIYIYKNPNNSQQLHQVIQLQEITEFFLGIPEDRAKDNLYPKVSSKMSTNLEMGLKDVNQIHWLRFENEKMMKKWMSAIGDVLKELGIVSEEKAQDELDFVSMMSFDSDVNWKDQEKNFGSSSTLQSNYKKMSIKVAKRNDISSTSIESSNIKPKPIKSKPFIPPPPPNFRMQEPFRCSGSGPGLPPIRMMMLPLRPGRMLFGQRRCF
ncbi:unnamed protein product, partial [Mesorhabditis belari]|uniref:PH domain-containing protein n=1 Tax=Mesorhabditis belari TaxID=2138241 RepID=A0AAF3J4J1_9BILA